MSKKKLFNNEDYSLRNEKNISDNLFSEDEIKALYENDFNISYKNDLTPDLIEEDNSAKWYILIVDDEPDVIAITKLALNNFEFKGKNLAFFEAHSFDEAVKILREEPDIALAFFRCCNEK